MPNIELSNKMVSLLLNGSILFVMILGGYKSYVVMQENNKTFDKKIETIGEQVIANYAFHSKAITTLTLRVSKIETKTKVADNEFKHVTAALNRLDKSVREARREIRNRNASYQLYQPEHDTGGQK